ncbi:hypothetical protein EUX98_g289 [Antrodiella citrinella]|uniref:S13-like H2TH domain-containing protein n=1 Tax=Antrodiella citrinella TaxID=2447956 RepID=A0A4S4N4K1_9APHY|nr:hypothetical protein EUX98_g289 [Antrodiella citrinella]
MHILGRLLPDNQFVAHGLTRFYGIGEVTAHRICARYLIHDRCKIGKLTPVQVTALTAFLSAPSNIPDAPWQPVAHPLFCPPPITEPIGLARRFKKPFAKKEAGEKSTNPLQNLRIESDLKREIRENIAHQRMIGSYVGRRHAMGLPVRGQSTRRNSKTAKKLNRVERRG